MIHDQMDGNSKAISEPVMMCQLGLTASLHNKPTMCEALYIKGSKALAFTGKV